MNPTLSRTTCPKHQHFQSDSLPYQQNWYPHKENLRKNATMDLQYSLGDNLQQQYQLDYRIRELMKKNTELEMMRNQQTVQIDTLDQEMDQLQNQLLQFMKISERTCRNKEGLTKISESNSKIQTNKIKQIKGNKQTTSSVNTFHTHSMVSQSIKQIKNQCYGQIQEQDRTSSNRESQISNQYEEKITMILDQYKKIIERQHQNNIQSKSKLQQNSKSIKQLNHKLKKKKQEVKQLKGHLQEQQWRINQYKEEVAQLQNQHIQEINIFKHNIQALSQQKSKLEEQVNQLQQKLAVNSSKCSELTTKVQFYDKQLTNLERRYEKQKNERIAFKDQYRNEIGHFEEMQDMVEKKMIEVSNQIEYYRKERLQSDCKIAKLKQILCYYTTKYPKQELQPLPTFGGKTEPILQQDINTSYFSFGCQSEPKSHNIFESLKINPPNRESRSSHEGKSSNLKHETLVAEQEQSLKSSKYLQGIGSIDSSFQSSRITQQQQKYKLQRQCYEQTIKSLLEQNQRLQKLMFTKCSKQDNPSIETEIKMMQISQIEF